MEGQANMAQMIDNDELEKLLELDGNGKPGWFCFDSRERGKSGRRNCFVSTPLLRHLKQKLEIFNLFNHQI